jgi:hypothetical protein
MTVATDEKTAQGYRGVVCGFCRQPIPLPGIVERTSSGETESGDSPRSIPTFHLRCRVCEREKTYHVGDIAEFQGTPRARMRPQGPLTRSLKVARAAHG